MFTAADVPISDSLVNPPAILAKASKEMHRWGRVRLSDEPGFKKVLTSCLDVPGYANIDESAALLAYLGYREDPKSRIWTPSIDFNKDIKIEVLQYPKHGKIGNVQPGSGEYGYRLTERNAEHLPTYRGWDKVVYAVEVKGQRYKVVIDLLSIPDGEVRGGQMCEWRPRLKSGWAVGAMPDISSTDYAAWQRSATLSALIASAQSTLTGFTDLPATALGQTTGEGASAQITLDSNAAGHGWYVDPTPLDNTDEYLPTSQAGVWQAKADSAAANRMDMLSVLLHEYGHALGLELSYDAGDFMNAALQPGQRRMPTATQLQQMAATAMPPMASIKILECEFMQNGRPDSNHYV
jgi:hypothetical protein